MQRSKFPILVGGALLLYALYANFQQQNPPAQPAPPATPAPALPKPKPKAPDQPCPRWPHRAAEQAPAPVSRRPQLGGIDSPDGAVHVLPLPSDLHWPKNIASKGLGCCTFRSLDYAARWQNVPELVDLPERMRQDGIPGGGFPQKLDQIIHQYAPNCPYWNDTSKSVELIQAAILSQRIACVDYSGHDPHYGGGIAHCVCVVGVDLANDWVAIFDNNYPSLSEIVWMGVSEFQQRWNGWCYGLLAQTPGYCAGRCSEEKGSFGVDDNGTVNFGLETASFPAAGTAILNGEPSTLDSIIDAIGPEMKPIDVNVNHHTDPIAIQLSPMTCALAGGGVLLAYLLLKREGE